MNSQNACIVNALALAASGDLDGSERLLLAKGTDLLTTTELDLLARIAVERGDDKHAAELWRRILAADPGNAVATAALAKLNSPWRTYATVRSIATWLVPVVCICGVAVCTFLLWHCQSKSRLATARAEAAEDRLLRATAGVHLPEINVKGIKVEMTPEGDARFSFTGAFPTGANLTGVAKAVLQAENAGLIIVEVGSGSPRESAARWIALRRGKVLAECLAEKTGISASQFAIAVSEETNKSAMSVRLVAKRMEGL